MRALHENPIRLDQEGNGPRGDGGCPRARRERHHAHSVQASFSATAAVVSPFRARISASPIV